MCVTKMRISLAICLACAVLNIKPVHPSQDLMKDMMVTFTKALDVCIEEMTLPKSVVQDFINFWKPDHEVTDDSFGCAVICLAAKLDIVDNIGNLHHGNAHEFIVSHGADPDKAKQLLSVFLECEKLFGEMTDDCARSLKTTKCFKAKIHDLDWAPSIEMIMAELLADI